MNKVVYRTVKKEDLGEISNLINEAWGFGKVIKDDDFTKAFCDVYLSSCLLEKNYIKIAEVNNRVAGVIMGCTKDNSLKAPSYLLFVIKSYILLIIKSRLFLKDKEFLNQYKKILRIYKDLKSRVNKDFHGTVTLFIVSERFRGFGIGKCLMNEFIDKCKASNTKNIYLYTDTMCNFGFYDKYGFKRSASETMDFNLMSKGNTLEVFLYSIELD